MIDISDLPALDDVGCAVSQRREETRRGEVEPGPPARKRAQAMAQAPPARRALVGSVLRGYREAAGYRLEDAAAVLECDPSKVSRIETGQRGIRPKELRELLTEYDADPGAQAALVALARPRDAGAWWRDYRRVLPAGYLDFAVAEGAASQILVYAPLRVPELLWTEEYGRAITAADPTVPEGAEQITVEAAIEYRGGRLFERRPDCAVILGEAALRHHAARPDAMRAQLARIAALSGPNYPWLDVRVLPFTAGTGSAAGECSILRFSGLPDTGLVHIAGPHGGVCLSDPPVIDAYTTTFNRMQSLSLNPEQSALLLRRAARR
jgi:transcriptional regulator with XRE-family HTH domain